MPRQNIFGAFCIIPILAAQIFAASVDAGNGIIAAPTAAAYQDLRNASNSILGDLKNTLPQAKIIILYDASTFAVVPYYANTTEIVRTAAVNLCNAEAAGAIAPRIVPSLDVGSATQGLVSLIQLTVPSYTVQSQNLTLDNSALVGSFATAAKAKDYSVVNPAYLLPAVSQTPLDCQKAKTSNSLADLWKFANNEANLAQAKADKKPVKDALAAFKMMKDTLTSSADKGPPLLGRVLTVESLARSVEHPAQIAVIDMRLDAANIDSTTRSVLWFRKTRISANIAAHYWIFSARGTGTQFGITLVEPGYVNILTKNLDLKKFAVNPH